MTDQLAARFDRMVDRSGEHHLWRGAKNPDRGTGRLKVARKNVTAHRVAWELAHGQLPQSVRVLACPDEPACVRVEHLKLDGDVPEQAGRNALRRGRARRGGGSMREVRPGVWQLTVAAGRYGDGTRRRISRNVTAVHADDAARQLAALVAELAEAPTAPRKDTRSTTVDDAVRTFLDEYLREEKGREERTITDYWKLHLKWFAPVFGSRAVRDVDEAVVDHGFGRMRAAGLSRSRLNHAKSLYVPFFRWAKKRQLTVRNPMADFQLPTSTHVSKERVPPEVEELSAMLQAAVEVVPDIAPILVLGAVTGMRRGELVGLRRSRLLSSERRITVDAAISTTRKVKGTKTRRERSFHVDDETMAMLLRHCVEMDERAALVGTAIARDAFVFSLEPDCSVPMPPDYVTKRVAGLEGRPRCPRQASGDNRARR